jgi:hypothetical protein
MRDFKPDDIIILQVTDDEQNQYHGNSGIQNHQKEIVKPVPAQFYFIKSLIGKMDYMGEKEDGYDDQIIVIGWDSLGSLQ